MGFFKNLGENLNQRSVFIKPTHSEKFSRYVKEVKSSKNREYKKQLYLMQKQQNIDEAERKANLFYNPVKPRYIDKAFKGFTEGRIRIIRHAQETKRPIESLASENFDSYRVGAKYKKFFMRGGRGRPKGSYDTRYAKYGGVYGYRKILSAQLQQQRMQNFRANAVTPQQEQIIRQMEARQNARRIDPENQTIPDTRGIIRMRSLHQEADDAANLVP